MTAARPIPKPPESLAVDRLDTPIGVALLVTDEGGYLRALDWSYCDDRYLRLAARYNGRAPVREGAAPVKTRDALTAYFEGELNALETIAWRTNGTAFQLACWNALCDIPVGRTASYGEQAVRIGRPRAVRAVGLANGANPVGLVAPCHRVIGADGTLTGYGGGLHRKRWLLRHEGATFRDQGEDTLRLAL